MLTNEPVASGSLTRKWKRRVSAPAKLFGSSAALSSVPAASNALSHSPILTAVATAPAALIISLVAGRTPGGGGGGVSPPSHLQSRARLSKKLHLNVALNRGDGGVICF